MSRRLRPHYRPGLGWILGIAFEDTLTRPVRLAQRFTFVRCCGSPRASSPHGLAAPGPASHDGVSLRAVASGSRLLPTRPAKDFHLQSSAHARHTLPTGRRLPTSFTAPQPPEGLILNLFPGIMMTTNRVPALAYSPPEPVQPTGTTATYRHHRIPAPLHLGRILTCDPIALEFKYVGFGYSSS
jgi:hypothetical protein